MITISMMKKSAAALAALVVLSAGRLQAQPDQAPGNRIPVEEMRSYGATASMHNERLLAEVMRDFGFSAERLNTRQRERLDDARYRLFPDQSPRQQRLNRTQAIAVVYTALVYPRGTGTGGGRGGWDDGRGGWDDGRDRGWDRERPGQCVEIDQRIYEMLNLVNTEGSWGIVDDEEKVKIRALATQVQGLAIARNYRQVADRAVDVMSSLTEWGTQRTLVRSRVNALREAVAQACGDDGQR